MNNLDVNYDSFEEFIEQLSTESQRAAVVISGAKIDQLLYFILKKLLVTCEDEKKDELLDGDTPLSTLSSRILICFRLGLIDAAFVKNLQFIRKIRNKFAHELVTDLDQSPNRDWAKELIKNVKTNELFNPINQTYFDGNNDLVSSYYTAIIIVVAHLEALLIKVEQINNENAMIL